MTLLPYNAFRRISLYARSVIVACFVAMLATGFAVPAGLQQTPEPHIRLLPPVWFLGLAQSFLNPDANSYMASLGRIAVIASVAVLVCSVVIYTISYQKRFMRIAEAAGTLGIGS